MRYDVECVKELYNGGDKLDFIFFWKPNQEEGVLSQWYPCLFSDGQYAYSSAEQYMMYQKALLMGDEQMADNILFENNPATIKKYGRLVKNFDESLWNAKKYEIVLNASIAKFSSNEILKDYLSSTVGKILVEASPYDAIWGIKMTKEDEKIKNPNNWMGENLLGTALMEARDIIFQ
jgi:hypothetical protein